MFGGWCWLLPRPLSGTLPFSLSIHLAVAGFKEMKSQAFYDLGLELPQSLLSYFLGQSKSQSQLRWRKEIDATSLWGKQQRHAAKRSFYRNGRNLCLCSTPPSTLLGKISVMQPSWKNFKVKEYSCAYYVDSTINILLYLPYIFIHLSSLFPSIHLIFLMHFKVNCRQQCFPLSTLCIFSKNEYLCAVFYFDKTFTHNE